MNRPCIIIQYITLTLLLVIGDVDSTTAQVPTVQSITPPQVPTVQYISPPIFQRISTVALSFSQSAVSDWQQGDKSLIDIKFGMTNRLLYTIKPLVSTATIRVLVGGQREYSDFFPQGVFRATDNEVFCENVFTLPLGLLADPYFSGSFRTQVTESHRLYKSVITRTSKLWDPVISQQAMGFAIQSIDGANRRSTRLGVTLQQIRTRYHSELSDNPMTPIKESYKADSGIEWISEVKQILDSTVQYSGRLATRATFKQLDRWTLLCENEFRVRIWKFIGATLTINLTYNPDQSATTQYRQAVSIGILQDM